MMFAAAISVRQRVYGGKEAFMKRDSTYVKMEGRFEEKAPYKKGMLTHQTPTYMLKKERRILPRFLPRHNKAQFRSSAARMG